MNDRTPRPALRLTIRQPVAQGETDVALDDGLEVIDADGNVFADLSMFLSRSTIERGVGEPSVVTLRMYGVEIVKESATV